MAFFQQVILWLRSQIFRDQFSLHTWGRERAVTPEASEAGREQTPPGVLTRLFDFWMPEGYEDQKGFHFCSGKSSDSGSPA